MQYNDPRIFNSSSSDGSVARFDISANAIQVPRNAHSVSIGLVSATFWYNFPNIIDKSWILRLYEQPVDTVPRTDRLEDLFSGTTQYRTDETVASSRMERLEGGSYQDLVIPIPTGLYSLTQLAGTLSRGLTNAGYPSDRIVLGGDNATQKCTFLFTVDSRDTVIFNKSGGIGKVVGVGEEDTTIQPPLFIDVKIPCFVLCPNVANFNAVNVVYIIMDEVFGVNTNGGCNGTLIAIPLQVSPGSQQVYVASYPILIPAQELAGRRLTSVTLRLTDEKGNSLNTLGETFSVCFDIQWKIA